MLAGKGLYIVVNANAKRGGRRIAVQITQALPGATVRLTKSIAELESWLRTIRAPRGIFSAGGDGTAVALLNALDRVHPSEPLPPVGALPLGTGNAWAHALGARKLDGCIRSLAMYSGAPLPTKRYALLRCDGVLTFFGGCGWDAQILDDYRLQVEQSPSSRIAKSVWGYLTAMIVRTAPKTIMYGRPHVIIENLCDEIYVIDREKKLERLDAPRGTILYEGMASVAGAATCPEFGYGFRAYPHAERLLDFMNVRVYDQKAPRAILDIPKLWRGEHPLRGMHDWFAKEVRMTFSRPMPLQIGGEAIGSRQTVEYKWSPRTVDAVDWRMLA